MLKPKVQVRRIVFHEITEEAIKEALREAHDDVDENLVRAQESRRILDRLYGYTLSPVLWKKVQTGLSAGRVQSVAVRLIVEREEERIAFRTASYWDLEAKIRGGRSRVHRHARPRRRPARRHRQGFRHARAADRQGRPRARRERRRTRWCDALSRNLPWTVTSVEEKPFTQRPAPPFTTSTLQQEANRKFGFSAERTMQIAQRLFQGMDIGGGDLEGLISYHRTDSTTLSEKALREARPGRQRDVRRRLSTRARASIRPRCATRRKRTRRFVRPNSAARRSRSSACSTATSCAIYDLIWKRAIASQMADARMLRTSVEITGDGHRRRAGRAHRERQGDRVCRLPARLRRGQRRSGGGARRAGNAAAEAGGRRTGLRRPTSSTRDSIVAGLEPRATRRRRRRATPKRRWSSGSKKKASAARRRTRRRSRPFSAAATSSRQGKALVPSFTAFAVTRLLREHFGDYVDLGFTAEMEEILDQISNGEKDWLDFIREFYRGDGKHHGLEHLVEDKGQEIDYPVIEVGDGSGERAADARAHRPLRSVPAAGRTATTARARRCPRIWRRRI